MVTYRCRLVECMGGKRESPVPQPAASATRRAGEGTHGTVGLAEVVRLPRGCAAAAGRRPASNVRLCHGPP